LGRTKAGYLASNGLLTVVFFLSNTLTGDQRAAAGLLALFVPRTAVVTVAIVASSFHRRTVAPLLASNGRATAGVINGHAHALFSSALAGFFAPLRLFTVVARGSDTGLTFGGTASKTFTLD